MIPVFEPFFEVCPIWGSLHKHPFLFYKKKTGNCPVFVYPLYSSEKTLPALGLLVQAFLNVLAFA